MQPRQSRETSSPVRPSLVYFTADSFYGAATISRGSHSMKWQALPWRGLRSRRHLQTALYSVEYIGDNSMAAWSPQPSHFLFVGKPALIPSSAHFSRLAVRCSPIRSTASRRPPACECATAFRKILGAPSRAYLRDEEQHSKQDRRKKDLGKCRRIPLNCETSHPDAVSTLNACPGAAVSRASAAVA